MRFKEIDGDLIKLALQSEFNVIAHGCNCFCKMSRGLAPQMARAFGCDTFKLEDSNYDGDINKLGQIDWEKYYYINPKPHFDEALIVVNAYTQYHWSTETKPLDYEALTLCMRKINYRFSNLHIGLPLIGCHLAGGDWSLVKPIIQRELKDMHVTIVHYKPE